MFLLLAACASDNTLNKVVRHDGEGEGSISGRVCDTERYVWLEGATVYTHIVSDDGELVGTREATTGEDGSWVLEDLPDGVFTVYVQYGSATLDMFDVQVGEGEEVVVDEPECTGAADVEVAVVSGDYDDMPTVLAALGIAEYNEVNGQTGEELVQFLTNTTELLTYDAIFFAGGHLEEDVFYDSDGVGGEAVDSVLTALKDYVSGGGVVVASDWSYDVVDRCWPDKIDFIGDDLVADDAQIGEPDTVRATLEDADLEDSIGAGTVEVQFDLDTWPVISEAGEGVTVWETATVPWRDGQEKGLSEDVPILVEFGPGDGRVLFSSWRFEANLEGGSLGVLRYVVGEL